MNIRKLCITHPKCLEQRMHSDLSVPEAWLSLGDGLSLVGLCAKLVPILIDSGRNIFTAIEGERELKA